MDNQRYNTAYPVALATSGEPALILRAVRDVSFRKRPFVYLPLVQLHLQPMSVMLDEVRGRRAVRGGGRAVSSRRSAGSLGGTRPVG